MAIAVSDETVNKANKILEYAGTVDKFSRKDLNLHFKEDHNTTPEEYKLTSAALAYLLGKGTLNRGLGGPTNRTPVHWLRKKGEKRVMIKTRNGTEQKSAKAKSPHVVTKAADYEPTAFQVIPVKGNSFENLDLWRVANDIKIEVSGSTLFLEYGGAKLVVPVKS